MNIRKFIAPTAREALQEIRNVLGGEAVILSNRKVENGVEIIALANEEVMNLTNRAAESKREFRESAGISVSGVASRTERAAQKPFAGQAQTPVQAKFKAPEKPVASIEVQQGQPMMGHDSILGEIKSMHSTLQQQLAVMSWTDMQQHDPQRAGLLTRMLNAGFSTLLTHRLLDKMPVGKTKGEWWIKRVLKLNLPISVTTDDIITKGGVYALIGPTGVGKTTTTAKLAARAVVRYGAEKVALITTDSYRIGAYDQLKIYGKILGVEVHAVKNADDLRLTISALRNKHLVLIDTVGMGQRDERVADQKEMFDATSVSRLLLLNATSSGDTLEEVVRMYHCDKVIGCIPTKLDEAVNIGAVLDVVVRHRLVMHYMANGQRVPEDLHPINLDGLDYLLHRVLKPTRTKSPFTLCDLEFPGVMAATGSQPRSVRAFPGKPNMEESHAL